MTLSRRDEVVFELLLNRAVNEEQYFTQKLKKQKIALSDFHYYMNLKLFAALDEKLRPVSGALEIPFHYFLGEISPTYQRTFAVGEQLGIQFQSCFKSYNRLISEFNPLKAIAEYPAIREELYWVLAQEASPKIIEDMRALLYFNFPTFHDILHVIFCHLIPAPSHYKNMHAYFSFLEALVILQEELLVKDLGPVLYGPLFSSKTVYKVYEKRKIKEENFSLEKFSNHFLHSLNYKLENVTPLTAGWLKKQEYPESLRKRSVKGMEKFHLDNFQKPFLEKHPEIIRSLWQWHKKIFS